jgi:hypothetical protein
MLDSLASRELQQLLYGFMVLAGIAVPLIVWWSERW